MLTDLDRAILNLERHWWKYPGAKANAIAELGVSETRYYQRLTALIDEPAAMEVDPLTVKRLQRVRDARRRARSAARLPS